MNNDKRAGNPETASGHAQTYGLSSISSAFPTHIRLKPKYPRENIKPIRAAFFGVADLWMEMYKLLIPINNAGQKFVGAIARAENAPAINIRIKFLMYAVLYAEWLQRK